SLLCGASASKMKDEEFNANQELLAQGIGNMIIPFFGGVPATAAIARTSVAIKSGCQTRLCGIIHALGLLASMFLLSPVMAKIPLSALAGVLLVTAWRMNEWESIRYIFGKRFYGAIAKFLLTMIATIVFGLTVAILIGIGFSALLFVYRASKISVYVSDIDEDKQNYTGSGSIGKDDTKIVYITGPVFFANVGKLEKFFADGVGGASELIISLRGVSSVDTSGVKFLCETCRGLEKAGTKVLFCGANETVAAMTQRGGIKDIVGENAFYPTADKAIHAALTDSYEAAER
ncbi:MAG: SulP family inorganic anion transporter, partial [Eubacteriales bacterium]